MTALPRRRVLALLAALPPLLTACGSGSPSARGSASPSAVDPDTRARTAVTAALRPLLASYDALTPAHPALAAAALTQLQSLTRPAPTASPSASATASGPARGVRADAVAKQELALARLCTSEVPRSSPSLARLLASLAAGATLRAVALGAKVHPDAHLLATTTSSPSPTPTTLATQTSTTPTPHHGKAKGHTKHPHGSAATTAPQPATLARSAQGQAGTGAGTILPAVAGPSARSATGRTGGADPRAVQADAPARSAAGQAGTMTGAIVLASVETGGSPSPSSGAAGAPSSGAAGAGMEALQGALGAEHAAVYGYGVLGAQLSGKARAQAQAYFDLHRGIRDALSARITAAGGTPVAAAPGYRLPYAVTDAASAKRLAALLENRLAAVWANGVRAAIGAQRAESAGQLLQAALRAQTWGGAVAAFPGLPERAASATR